jgi:hypothetical protein
MLRDCFLRTPFLSSEVIKKREMNVKKLDGGSLIERGCGSRYFQRGFHRREANYFETSELCQIFSSFDKFFSESAPTSRLPSKQYRFVAKQKSFQNSEVGHESDASRSITLLFPYNVKVQE